MKWIHCLVALVALQFPVAAVAKEDRVALIIAISEYASADIPKLQGVPHDIVSAQRIAREMGIPESKVRILRDAQATKAGVLNAVRQLGEAAAPGTRAFMYYSGHGTRYYSKEFNGCIEGLLTYDQQTITNDELAKASELLFARADKVMTLIDACHSEGVAPPRKNRMRDLGQRPAFMPKVFLSKSGIGAEQCTQISNHRTRSLLTSSTRLGALQENVVQVTSSRPDEVSFDEAGKGGLATQAVRDCLLGEAPDTNASGGVSMEEIQSCAQAKINAKLSNVEGFAPHHVTVSGNRNLIPVSSASASSGTASSAALSSVAAPAAIASSAINSPPAIPPTALASLATLQDIHSQRDPRRVIDVKLPKTQLKIDADPLDMTLTSNHDGFVYLVLLGSDAKSFYILFPNGLDSDNRISANIPLRLPRPHWAIKAAGPPGTDQLLVLVTESPRDLGKVKMAPPSASEPFTFALSDFSGRARLLDFLIGRGHVGGSESFGAALLQIREVP